MSRIFSLLAAILVPAALAAQQPPQCPRGAADDQSIQISSRVAQPPSRIAPLIDAAFARHGFRAPPARPAFGSVTTDPSWTWPSEANAETLTGPHPGLRIAVHLRPARDSTEVAVAARAICAGEPVAGADSLTTDGMAEMLVGMLVASGLFESIGALPAWTPSAADSVAAESKSGVNVPDSIAGFAFASRHDYEDTRYGTQLRYARGETQIDVFVFPGPPANASCTSACAQQFVDEDVAGFIQQIPVVISRYGYDELRVRTNTALVPGPASAWRGGRHLLLDAQVRGRKLASHYYLFSYPGYLLKVRATVPPAGDDAERVQRFVDAALGLFAPLPSGS